MKYRIVRRNDPTLKKSFYYIQSRKFIWNSWQELRGKYSSKESAYNQLECYLTEDEIMVVD